MPPAFHPARVRSIRRLLLGWYDASRRELPWRRTYDPYAIWLSEMMLQQTQVATVISYYERFLARFATVQALADADLDEVLRLWAGLGYYARARSLHAAAKLVANEFNGRFPETVDELRRLPGVGPYTAAAVASIAFDRPAATVDGNVARVLARLLNSRLNARTTRGRATIAAAAAELLPVTRPGDFNQAMMELGATVCLPGGAARCGTCPLCRDCAARAAGAVANLPVRMRKPSVKQETHLVAAIERAGRWLILRRPSEGLWGGLWELPTTALVDVADDGTLPRAVVRRLVRETCGQDCEPVATPFCDIRHQLTHRTIRFVGYVCHAQAGEHARTQQDPGSARKKPGRTTPAALAKAAPGKPIGVRWLRLDELPHLGMSKAMRKVVAALEQVKTAGPARRANRQRAGQGNRSGGL